MTTFASIVDWDALLATVAASVIAGLGVVIAFSIAIYGAARFAEGRRVGAPLETGLDQQAADGAWDSLVTAYAVLRGLVSTLEQQRLIQSALSAAIEAG